ncbi:HAD-IIA family hydrolase [Campylobacter troglodytis]|uniref:HAD-IIA family hydrolase n=1 Tax=Campylobacter troglodytis TaxID=654363 RepID=UPI00115987AD|nr:HAD-IIA family hydrolase [Campylobacter troglodytis]TQR61639.1 HAD family hydrolase [Campylobacter troglodytis]
MLFVDVQGTLISDVDKSCIDGACELVSFLNSKQIPYLIITNNTKDLNFLENLRKKGLEIKENAYLDPFFVLKESLKPCKVAAFGDKKFKNALCELNFSLDYEEPEALIVASWDQFHFDDFALMIELIKKGVRLIAMHETSIYKKGDKAYPGVGAMMQMLHYATNAEYEVFGKPSVAFYELGLELLQKQEKGAKFSDILIISDDFKGDLVKAKELGMKIALVLSGKINSTKGLDLKDEDRVYASVKEYLKELKGA